MTVRHTRTFATAIVVATLAAFLPAQSPGFWEKRTSLTTARQEVGAAVLNGLVYCAGGLHPSRTVLNTVERYDPKTQKWTAVASMPTTLHHFGMAEAGGKIYTIGGYVSNFTGTAKCHAYDPSTNKWSAIQSLPRARGALGAATINGKIYAVGGVVPVQARATAVGTGLAIQKFRKFFANCAGLGFTITSIEVRNDTLETMQFLNLHAARIRIVKLNFLGAAAVQDDVTQFLAEFIERRFDVEIIMRRQALNHLVVIRRFAIPAADCAAGEGQGFVNNNAFRVKELFNPETVTGRAGAGRIVE